LAQEKVIAGATTQADEILIRHLPKIRAFFKEKMGLAVVTTMKDDAMIAELSKIVYGLLPVMLRLAVKEERFVRFCLANRDKLVGTTESAKTADVLEER
jgi:hypothetical protein